MFVVMFAYLPNVFSHLNDTKLSLQGRDVTVNNVAVKVINLHFFDCMNLKMRLKSFFEKIKTTSVSYFTMKMFVVMFAYLPNVFSHLNDMNLSLQGRDVAVGDVKDKLAGLTARMRVWQARIKIGSTASFPLLAPENE